MDITIGLALIILLAFLVLSRWFMARFKAGYRPRLRRIAGFSRLRHLLAEAVETGRPLHLSVGVGGVGNETTADTLAGLSVLGYLARQSAQTGTPPIVTTADPAAMLAAQNTARSAARGSAAEAAVSAGQVRWVAPQPAAYAAGVMNLLDAGQAGANVMVGKFGDEYLLMGETAARRRLPHIGGAGDPNTLPFIYVTAQETLLGEDIYAAGAYLQRRPTQVAGLLAQDVLRWLIGAAVLGGILVQTLR